MKEAFEKKYHDVEKKHWWFKSRRHCIQKWLGHASRESRILDIGCSSGLLLTELRQMGFAAENLYGIDISQSAVDNAKKNGLQNVFVCDAQNINIEQQFDYILASDCLEHLENDQVALKNWLRLLNPCRQAIIFVPAFMSLWSQHDLANMHFRRYTRNELKIKIASAGFSIKHSGYWNVLLFIPVFLYRGLSRLLYSKEKAHGDISQPPQFVNLFLIKWLTFENYLLKSVPFPFGVSTYCIAKK